MDQSDSGKATKRINGRQRLAVLIKVRDGASQERNGVVETQ